VDRFEDNKIYSDNVRWLIQIPRLFNLYKENHILHNFQEMLENIFTPLIQVTLDPSSNPSLHRLLQQGKYFLALFIILFPTVIVIMMSIVVGFDSVDDESVVQPRLNWSRIGPPHHWTFDVNPPYSYYSFYIYANLYVVNK
jgi:AMP deaminase